MPMENLDWKDEPVLLGSEAWAWLSHRGALGPHLLDFALGVLPGTFGVDRRAGALVPVDPYRGRRWDFFLTVEGRADHSRDWRRLVRFHEELIVYLDGLAASGIQMRLADRFHPVLIAEPPGGVPLSRVAEEWLPS